MQKVKYFLVSTSLLLMAQGTWAMEERKDENESFSVRATSQEASRNKEDEKSLGYPSRGIDSEEEEAVVFSPSRNSLALEQSVVTEASAENLTNLVIGKAHIEILPSEILTLIFTFLDIKDLGRSAPVSSSWKAVLDAPDVWRILGLRKYSEYLTEGDLKTNPKETVVLHSLSVHVNALSDLQEIDRIVRHHRLDLYKPSFKKHTVGDEISELIVKMVKCAQYNEELIAQSNERAILKKVKGLSHGLEGYQKNPAAAREFNDDLVAKGDQWAIERKLNGLGRGGEKRFVSCPYVGSYFCGADTYTLPLYGYEINPVAAREFNEILVEKGDQVAIKRKINDLSRGENSEGAYGYERNPAAAREINDDLVEKGDQVAIQRKFWGISNGEYGYEKNPVIERELNEFFVEKGDQVAIRGKVWGLSEGKHGYERNPQAAREFNDALIEEGDPEAIERKIEGLSKGGYGYEQDLATVREFNDDLVEKGDQEAIRRKVWGLSEGKHGYEKNPAAARAFNEIFIAQGDKKGIERKIEGLLYGKYGYEKNPIAAREFNASLVENLETHKTLKKLEQQAEKLSKSEIENDLILTNNPIVRGIGYYLKVLGLKYGIFGYERDREKAIEYIKEFSVPF